MRGPGGRLLPTASGRGRGRLLDQGREPARATLDDQHQRSPTAARRLVPSPLFTTPAGGRRAHAATLGVEHRRHAGRPARTRGGLTLTSVGDVLRRLQALDVELADTESPTRAGHHRVPRHEDGHQERTTLPATVGLARATVGSPATRAAHAEPHGHGARARAGGRRRGGADPSTVDRDPDARRPRGRGDRPRAPLRGRDVAGPARRWRARLGARRWWWWPRCPRSSRVARSTVVSAGVTASWALSPPSSRSWSPRPGPPDVRRRSCRGASGRRPCPGRSASSCWRGSPATSCSGAAPPRTPGVTC